MPIWRTGAPPPSPPRAANGGGKCPAAGCSKSQSRYVQTTIFARIGFLRGRGRLRRTGSWRRGLLWRTRRRGLGAAAQAGRRAGLCRRTNRFPIARRGEKPLVSERPPARFQEFRAEFRELLSDGAWTPPVDFPLVSKKHRQTRAFQDSVQKGRKGILLHLRQRSLMRPRPLPVQNRPGDRRRQKNSSPSCTDWWHDVAVRTGTHHATAAGRRGREEP